MKSVQSVAFCPSVWAGARSNGRRVLISRSFARHCGTTMLIGSELIGSDCTSRGVAPLPAPAGASRSTCGPLHDPGELSSRYTSILQAFLWRHQGISLLL